MRHLFVGNPMFAELQRQRRAALSKSNWSGGPLGARILVISIYLYLVYLTVNNPRSAEPVAFLYILLILMFICLPATMHGVIAGDRERRSIDLLLVAPVTPGQIIIGKYMRGIALMVGLVLAIGVPCLVLILIHGKQGSTFYWTDTYGAIGFLRAILLIVSTGAFLASLSVWVSTRSKSNGAALLAIVGATFFIYVVLPVVWTVLAVMDREFSDFMAGMHPFVALSNTYLVSPGITSGVNNITTATLTTLAQFALAAVFLLLARNQLSRIAKGVC